MYRLGYNDIMYTCYDVRIRCTYIYIYIFEDLISIFSSRTYIVLG